MSPLNLSGKTSQIYGQRHALWLSPRGVSAQVLGTSEFASFAAKTSICNAIFFVGYASSFILAIQARGKLNGIELRTAFLRQRLRNEFTAKAAFFAFDLP